MDLLFLVGTHGYIVKVLAGFFKFLIRQNVHKNDPVNNLQSKRGLSFKKLSLCCHSTKNLRI